MKKFVVYADTFELYKKFKEEVEKLGWKYCTEFFPFKEDERYLSLCFDNQFWKEDVKIGEGRLFAFTIWDATEDYAFFVLEDQFEEALAHAKSIVL